MPGWYPSHMPRARRELRDNLRLVDVVIEIVDARIPASSRIPDLQSLCSGKPTIVALNKADLADPEATRAWLESLESSGVAACAVNASAGDGIPQMIALARQRAQAAFAAQKRLRPFRAMAVGIPNVGKSSLLNRLAGAKAARTGDRPGITRGKQWLRIAADLELLDLPGILWPQQSLDSSFHLLCATGAVPDDAFDGPEVAGFLLELLRDQVEKAFAERYGIEDISLGPEVLLERIAKRRGLLVSGGQPDITKAARAFLADFRSARLGRFTLERPGR